MQIEEALGSGHALAQKGALVSFKSGITSYPKDQFYGFATQSIEEDVMTMPSLAFIKVSKVCLDTFKIEEAIQFCICFSATAINRGR